MDVSVIIVNYNSSSLINNCLKSIIANTHNINYEVIIIDNNTEILEDVIINPGIKHLKFLQLNNNIGFGQANNKGVELASGDMVLLLNPDTLLLNNAIKILYDFIIQNTNCGVCGGNLFDENLNPIHSYVMWRPGIVEALNRFSNFRISNLLFSRNFQHNFTNKPIEVGYITGADLMIPKELFLKIGGFRNQYFMYYEETDLCYRVSHLGFKIFAIPQAEIIHLESQTIPSDNKLFKKDELMQKGLANYLKLNFNKLHRWFSSKIYLLFFSYASKKVENDILKKRFEIRYKSFKQSIDNKNFINI